MRFMLLATLTVTTLIVFWLIQPDNRMTVDADRFQVEDPATITRVEMIRDSSVVSLAFDGARWRVNDTYDADNGMVRVLFATLQQAKPKRPVASQRQDSIYHRLADTGTEVALYEGQALRKQFLAGGNDTKTQAFFADPATKEVYVMAIPGYRVYVSGIFELDANGWRDKFVFGFNWRNFKTLEMKFLEHPAGNFRVEMEREQLRFVGVPEPDSARLNAYLDEVFLLTVDDYLSEPELRDSLLALDADFQLLVTDVANRTYRLRVYNDPGAQQVWGIVQDDDLARFDRNKIQRLLRPRSFFSKK